MLSRPITYANVALDALALAGLVRASVASGAFSGVPYAGRGLVWFIPLMAIVIIDAGVLLLMTQRNAKKAFITYYGFKETGEVTHWGTIDLISMTKSLS